MNPERCFIRLFVPLLALLVGLCGCGKGGGSAAAKTDPVLKAKLEAIRQAGQPVTPTELNAWYTEPAAGENAAPLYGQAFAALATVDAKAKEFLAKNQQVLPLLHQAAAKTECRYPVNLTEGPSTRLPHLSKVRPCVQLLAREAAASASRGQMDLAAQWLTDGFRLARSVEHEPLLISQVVRMAAEGIVCSGLEGVLSIRAFSEEQLAPLQVVVRGGEETIGPSLVRGIAGERCNAIGIFQMSPQAYEKTGTTLGTNFPFGTPAEFEHYRGTPVFKADFNLCLDFYSNWLAVISMPFPDCLAAAGRWIPAATDLVSDAGGEGCRISAVMLAGLGSPPERAADCTGQLRAAATALAVERYRLANSNALPESLDQLVPKYLDSVPDDPYDGKPLRYKKLSPKGYVVYSIGRNRQDDGGVPKPVGEKPDGPYDVAFTVQR